MIDVDYIIPEQTIKTALSFKGDRMNFTRKFGILNEQSEIISDKESMLNYGAKPRWMKRDYVPGHRSQFLMRKDLFWKLGGYNEALDGKWRRTGGAGEKFWRVWQRAEAAGTVKMHSEKPTIFMHPTGKFTTKHNALFHSLERKE